MENKTERYGLITTISMIVGIVIGSGIFFKINKILIATNGNVYLGILVFAFASLAIIFGSLTLAELAFRSKNNGGIVSYANDIYGKTVSGIFGWFLTFIYFPTIRSVVAWVAIIYLSNLLELGLSLEFQILFTLLLLIFITLGNIISAKGSGIFQVFATITKLLPLFLLTIIGFFFHGSFSNSSNELISSSNNSGNLFLGFIAALGPISFSFDGWTVSTSVTGEIKNKRRTLPLALTFAPLFILVIYVMFFIGITNLMSPETIMSHGNQYIYILLNDLVGSIGAKLLMFTLVISMIGTTNGVTLGDSRTVNHLAEENLIFKSHLLSKKSGPNKIPVNALLFSTLITTFWLAIHYLTLKFNLLENSDISEIAISTLYLLLVFLYIGVIKLRVKGEMKSNIKGYVFPILAIIGSIIIFSGAIQNKYFILYFTLSALALLFGFIYLKRKK